MDNESKPDNYFCRKCTQLELLTELMNWLERQLETLRSTQMVESIIDRSYRNVVTPKVQKDRWVTTRWGRHSVQEFLAAVPLSSKYSVLDTHKGNGPSGDSSNSWSSGTVAGPAVQRGRTKYSRAIVIGDSIVRGRDRRFCGHDRDSRM
eukprot:g24826.t1